MISPRKILAQLEKGQPLSVVMRPLVRAIVALAGQVIRNGPPQRAYRRMGLSRFRLSN
jgi:hypothetical protein